MLVSTTVLSCRLLTSRTATKIRSRSTKPASRRSGNERLKRSRTSKFARLSETRTHSWLCLTSVAEKRKRQRRAFKERDAQDKRVRKQVSRERASYLRCTKDACAAALCTYIWTMYAVATIDIVTNRTSLPTRSNMIRTLPASRSSSYEWHIVSGYPEVAT